MEPQYLSFKHNNKPLYLRKARKQNKISTHQKALETKYKLATVLKNSTIEPISFIPNGFITKQMVRNLKRY
jgi:ribosomal protein S4